MRAGPARFYSLSAHTSVVLYAKRASDLKAKLKRKANRQNQRVEKKDTNYIHLDARLKSGLVRRRVEMLLQTTYVPMRAGPARFQSLSVQLNKGLDQTESLHPQSTRRKGKQKLYASQCAT